MPETDKPARPKPPAWMEKANLFYGSAFDLSDKDGLASAIHDFAELSDAEQRFMLAHLLYLNLQAQASQVRLLRDQRDTLDELSADVGEGLDLLADEQVEGEGGGEPDEEADEPEAAPLAAQVPPAAQAQQ